ncbi:MAG: Slp family lipoprotein [Nitrospiraceae bacterium]|jgi:outer membrane lipoprotein|nr:MAG: Slp family lipoprotein [Nitrospiraceae bacterium]
MKQIKLFTALALFLIASCTYVLQEDLMKSGTIDINPASLRQDTAQYTGKLYILGGIIAKTTVTDEGTLIEALYVPVDSRGYLKDAAPSNWRFLALNRGEEFLDPLIFSTNKKVTIAGVFKETRKGMIGEMEYTFPLFEIREVHLWEETKYRYRYYYPDYDFYPPVYFRYRHYYPAYPYYYWWYY